MRTTYNKYRNGGQELLLHGIDGPTVIVWGDQFWGVNGKRHRTNGPAVIRLNGDHEWWVNGRDITQEVNAWMQKQGVIWPWDEETQVQFTLTFC
jgi:hypothetical protein